MSADTDKLRALVERYAAEIIGKRRAYDDFPNETAYYGEEQATNDLLRFLSEAVKELGVVEAIEKYGGIHSRHILTRIRELEEITKEV